MVPRGPAPTVVVDGSPVGGFHLQTTKEFGEMNGTMRRLLGRSVQLAVMAAPSASVAQAVAEARRRHDTSGEWSSRPEASLSLRPQAVAG